MRLALASSDFSDAHVLFLRASRPAPVVDCAARAARRRSGRVGIGGGAARGGSASPDPRPGRRHHGAPLGLPEDREPERWQPLGRDCGVRRLRQVRRRADALRGLPRPPPGVLVPVRDRPLAAGAARRDRRRCELPRRTRPRDAPLLRKRPGRGARRRGRSRRSEPEAGRVDERLPGIRLRDVPARSRRAAPARHLHVQGEGGERRRGRGERGHRVQRGQSRPARAHPRDARPAAGGQFQRSARASQSGMRFGTASAAARPESGSSWRPT